MRNSEKLIKIAEELESNHINLYHDISKENFYLYRDNLLLNIDSLNDLEFDYELKKMFALFKDAHTNYYIPDQKLQVKLAFIDEKVFLVKNNENQQKKFCEVAKINGIAINEIIEKFKPTINRETNEWLRYKIEEAFSNLYYYKMLNFVDANAENINFELSSGEIITVPLIDEITKRTFSYNYSYKINNSKLYIRYKKCAEHETYSFNQYVEELKVATDGKNITGVIVDVRNNTGGNSSIIKPLEKFLKEKNIPIAVLINYGVFSAGRFAVMDFKKDFNAVLIGTPTGGAATSYGNNKTLHVDDKNFACSTNYWDFSSVFGTAGSVQPDIMARNTIEDLENGIDRPLAVATEYLDNLINNINK